MKSRVNTVHLPRPDSLHYVSGLPRGLYLDPNTGVSGQLTPEEVASIRTLMSKNSEMEKELEELRKVNQSLTRNIQVLSGGTASEAEQRAAYVEVLISTGMDRAQAELKTKRDFEAEVNIPEDMDPKKKEEEGALEGLDPKIRKLLEESEGKDDERFEQIQRELNSLRAKQSDHSAKEKREQIQAMAAAQMQPLLEEMRKAVFGDKKGELKLKEETQSWMRREIEEKSLQDTIAQARRMGMMPTEQQIRAIVEDAGKSVASKYQSVISDLNPVGRAGETASGPDPFEQYREKEPAKRVSLRALSEGKISPEAAEEAEDLARGDELVLLAAKTAEGNTDTSV